MEFRSESLRLIRDYCTPKAEYFIGRWGELLLDICKSNRVDEFRVNFTNNN